MRAEVRQILFPSGVGPAIRQQGVMVTALATQARQTATTPLPTVTGYGAGGSTNIDATGEEVRRDCLSRPT